MATVTNTTVFVIKNNQGQFLSYQPYNGLRSWINEYTDSCAFKTQNEAVLYCRSLMADAENHGHDFGVDVFRYDNKIADLDVKIPNQNAYGLPENPTSEVVEDDIAGKTEE